jgi:gelsolin
MPWLSSKVAAAIPIAQKKWDGDGVPLEDSNIAGIGGEEDAALRKAAAGGEAAWQGVGLEAGLWIWRIEDFQVVAWPKKQYGKFHEGDSYICLHVQMDPEAEDEKSKLIRDIYFWLGSKTSTDEKGTAAYKTVELDDFFDGEPTQHRETQGHESRGFQALFAEGELHYLKGGVDSGFKVTQQDVFVNKLYQVRKEGKKIIFEEEQIALKSLNHRDAFILDTGRKIYVWFGDSASPFVKNAANMKAENMENERDGESKVETEVDDEFWATLGGKGDITAADHVGEEVEVDFGEGVLYSVNVIGEEDARTLEVKEVGRGEITHAMLDTTAVMMLDTRTEIIMWCGHESSKAEQRIAFKTATNYLKMNGRDVDGTSIALIKEGQKNAVWEKTFRD